MENSFSRMHEQNWLAERFEENRAHLGAVAYRMLGSASEADDAVQESWLRLSRTDTDSIENLGGWLTTVIARVCLDMLRSRQSRREESLDAQIPETIEDSAKRNNPEHEILLADSVGLAMLVVLETLAPAERLAFVLHDMFALTFEEIASIVQRSPTATRQLASRARRRIQGENRLPIATLKSQREVIEAFLAASRRGDFEALLKVLDPEIVVYSDGAADGQKEVRGAAKVIEQARRFSGRSQFSQLALVNGTVGIIVAPRGQLLVVLQFTIHQGRITRINATADRTALNRLDLAILSE